MAKLIGNRKLPFKRYWRSYAQPRDDSEASRAEGIDGFLPDPEGPYAKYTKLGLTSLDAIAASRCAVLLGQPGQGKTIEVEQWLDRARANCALNDAVIEVRGSAVGDARDLKDETVHSTEWQRASKAGGEITLLVDGLDEATQRSPVLVNSLVQYLKRERPEKMRVLLVSRVADWREAQTESFFELWDKEQRGGVFELCQLTHRDAVLGLRESGVEPDAFLQALHDLRALWMAARPKLLLMLIDEFRAGGPLPQSRRELFHRAALRMCSELDEERARRLKRQPFPAEQTYAIVARIAAVMLLSTKSRILCRQNEAKRNTDLRVADLEGGEERVGETSVEATAQRVQAALDTNHFTGGGVNRLRFDHQTMMEFMASEFLKRLTVVQLRGILCQRVEGRDDLAPQQREVGAWIAVMKPEFCEFLIETDPAFLLEADAAELDEGMKARAVGRMLDMMDREEAFDEFGKGLFFRGLHHKGLAKQLLPYISDSKRNAVVRRTAIRIAGETQCKTLEPELWRIVSGPAQVSVRNCAIHAIEDMATARTVPAFLRALRVAGANDPDDSLKGIALRFLVPKFLSVAESLRYLVPRNDQIIGSYWSVLHSHLPNNVKLSDVPAVLRHLERQTHLFRPTGHLTELANATLKLALRHFGKPSIRRAVIHFWVARLPHHDAMPRWSELCSEEISAAAATKLRRDFTKCIIEIAGAKEVRWSNLHPGPEDLGWLLKELLKAPKRVRVVWADLTARLCYRPERRKFNREFQNAYRSCAELRKALPSPKHYDISTTLDRGWKAWELKQQRNERRQERDLANQSRALWLKRALAGIRTGNGRWWPELVRVVSASDPKDEANGLLRDRNSDDITTAPGWSQMSAADKKIAMRLAETFLLECPPPPRKPGLHYTFDDAAYQAVGLRLHRIRQNGRLRDAIRRKWLPAIFDEGLNGGEDWKARLRLAYRIDAPACLQWFRRKMAAEDQQKFGISSPAAFRGFWNSDLTKVLRSFLLVARQPTSLVRGISFLVQQDCGVAFKIWSHLYEKTGMQPFNRRRRALCLIGMFCFPDKQWNLLFKDLRNHSRATQIRFSIEAARSLSHVIDGWSERLNDAQIADWYLMLANLFPPDRTRGYERGGTVRARDLISDLHRACVGILINRGTPSSCKELFRISESVPVHQRVWHRWHYNNCIQQRLQTEWARDIPSPEIILKMSRISSAIQVRDNEELQDATVQSLRRLQSEMHRGSHPRLFNLWTGEPGRPHKEKRVQALVAQWLGDDLSRGDTVAIDREVQIGHTGHSDIKVEIPANPKNARPRLMVIVEVKRSMHSDVQTACESQLAEGYLRRKQLTHGVYLVAWFDVADARLHWKSPEQAWTQVGAWTTASSSAPIVIKPFVLDCRWKDMQAPSS